MDVKLVLMDHHGLADVDSQTHCLVCFGKCGDHSDKCQQFYSVSAYPNVFSIPDTTDIWATLHQLLFNTLP